MEHLEFFLFRVLFCLFFGFCYCKLYGEYLLYLLFILTARGLHCGVWALGHGRLLSLQNMGSRA